MVTRRSDEFRMNRLKENFDYRVASTNHYHIVFKIHVLVFSAKVRNKFDFLFVLL